MNNNTTNGGHTLGGSGEGAASADDIRQRRLAALGGAENSADASAKASAPATTAASTASMTNSSAAASGTTTSNTTSVSPTTTKQAWFAEPEVDDDDLELQRALALSLGQTTGTPSGYEHPTNNINMHAESNVPPAIVNTKGFSITTSQQQSALARKDSAGDESNLRHYSEIVKECWKTATAFDIAQFHGFMWDTGLTTDNDKSRWVGQGIAFRGQDQQGSTAQIPTGMETGNTMLAALAKDHGPWGLVQSHGGPCGVLAAIQAELLRLILFGRRNPLDYPRPTEPGMMPAQCAPTEPTPELVREALARAIALILARSAITPSAANAVQDNERRSVGVVLPSRPSEALTWNDLEPWLSPPNTRTKSTTLNVYTVTPKDPEAPNALSHKRQKVNGSDESRDEKIVKLARAVTAFLLDEKEAPGKTAPLECFQRPGGVMLLVVSMVATRGRDVIQGEMDDPIGTKLTSQFGHCGQELINLLLTGQAVSNVFDNTLTPSGELTCRGIQHWPNIGYLSQLESLRYCEVGGYYKSPHFPIWVVGSTSHFTVLFGDANCLKESESDMLLEKCRRAFKAVEGGEENGFISSQNLEKVLTTLGVNLGGEHYYSTLAASLEVSDAGIILWDDFWKATSRLMTGATVEQVLNDAPAIGPSKNTATDNDIPPLLLTNGEGVSEHDLDRKPAAMTANAAPVESDEELAKRLSTQWEFEAKPSASAAASAPAARASPMEIEPTTLSDEELARKMQAEWDAEVSGGGTESSVGAVAGSQGSPAWSNFLDTNSSIATPDMTPMGSVEDSQNPQCGNTKEQGPKLDFEKYGDSFSLYHYNGLRGGTLTPFRVTRLSAEEAVGASIALNRGNNSHSGGSGDLEDVVRTKWPSCMINWLGQRPPFID